MGECRDVSAAAELLVEVWDVGGSTRGTRQLERLSQDPSKVIASSRFLGSVEVPLSATLAMSRGALCSTCCLQILSHLTPVSIHTIALTTALAKEGLFYGQQIGNGWPQIIWTLRFWAVLKIVRGC